MGGIGAGHLELVGVKADVVFAVAVVLSLAAGERIWFSVPARDPARPPGGRGQDQHRGSELLGRWRRVGVDPLASSMGGRSARLSKVLHFQYIRLTDADSWPTNGTIGTVPHR